MDSGSSEAEAWRTAKAVGAVGERWGGGEKGSCGIW